MNKLVIKKELADIGLLATSIQFLNLGTSKNNYIIKTKEGKYILKLFRKDKMGEIQKQMNLMREANKKEILTVSPIHEKILNLGPNVGYVYRFIEGGPYRKIKIKNKLYTFGKVLGRFNRLTKKIMPVKKDSSYIIKDYRKAKETIKYLEGKTKLLQKRSKKLLEAGTKIIDEEYDGFKFRTQLIHGDLHQDNVLYENGKPVIIDTEGFQNSVLAREVSTWITYLVVNPMPKFKKDVETFLSGYESEYKLTKKEKELMPILLIIRKIGEIVYLLKLEKKKALSEKEIKFFLGHTTRKLGLIIKNYESIKKMFKDI